MNIGVCCQDGWKHKDGKLAEKLFPMPAKPAWGKSFIYGGFKSHLMHLWDAFLGHNTTAVVICAGAKTLRFSVALVECMAQNMQATIYCREMQMALPMKCVP